MAKRSGSDNFPSNVKRSASSSGVDCGSQESQFLQIHPRSLYSQGSVTLRKPLFIGDFSLDEHRHFHHDQRNLHFIPMEWRHTKKVKFDLNVAMDKVVRKNHFQNKKEKIDHILEWILLNTEKFHTKESAGKNLHCLSTDFVCFRGLLTQLLCTPYENREGWIICATKYRNTIYLCAYDTPRKRAQEENKTEEQKVMMSWGYKFEQYMIDGSNPSEGVNENEEYCVMMRSRLMNHSLVYGAEVDGADPTAYKTPHADLSAFVELKTTKELTQERDCVTLHRFKMIKWWSQSYLVGIPRVVCGVRDESGIVHTLKTYPIHEMPKLGQDYWNTNIMVNFLNYFLDFVKRNVRVDNPQCVYKFERLDGDDTISCVYLDNDPQWTFLPEWYYNKVFKS